jgi:uncharacterized protein (TIGR03083 family)
MIDDLATIRREAERFYAVAAGADRSARVPCCPDWSIDDLIWHLLEVHWFWATIVEERITAEDGLDLLERPERPETGALVDHGRAQVDRLLRVLAAADPALHVWTWSQQEDVAFIRRHQVQEAAVHRWDMQSAAGQAPDPIEPAVAADSIDEFLTHSLPYALREGDLTGSVHLHCTDTDGEWIVQPGGAVEAVHAKGDVALRATASDLLLALYQRIPLDQLDVVGDATVAEDFVRRLVMD